MKVISIGNDYELTKRLKSIQAKPTVNDTATIPVQRPEETSGKPSEAETKTEKPEPQAKKKIRRKKAN